MCDLRSVKGPIPPPVTCPDRGRVYRLLAVGPPFALRHNKRQAAHQGMQSNDCRTYSASPKPSEPI